MENKVIHLLQKIISKKDDNNCSSISIMSNLNLYLKLKAECVQYIQDSEKGDFNKIARILNEFINTDSPLPFELLVSFLFYLDGCTVDIKHKTKLSDVILKYMQRNIHYNLSEEVLDKVCSLIKKNESYNTKIDVIKNHIKILTRIEVETDDEYNVLGFSFKNSNKKELVNYFKGFENYYLVPYGERIIYKLERETLTKIDEIKINDNKKNISGYNILNHFINLHGTVDINNQLQRIYLYLTFEDMYRNRTIRYNQQLNRVIIDNEMLFNSIAFSKIYDELMDGLGKYNAGVNQRIRQLEENPTNNTLIAIIKNESDTKNIYNVLKRAPYIMKEKIHFDNYVIFLNKCKEQKDYSLRVGLLCEELLINNPILINDIIYFIKRIYEEEIFTEYTHRAIEFIRCAIDDHTVDLVTIKLKARENKFDLIFTDKLLKLYYTNNDLDNVINKMINNKEFYFKPDLGKVIYDFYKKYNDINALNILVRKCLEEGINLLSFGIEEADIDNLFEYYISHNIVNKDEMYLKLGVLYKKSDKVRNGIIAEIQDAYNNNNHDYIKLLKNKYKVLIFRWYKENTFILKLIIEMLSKERLEKDNNIKDRVNILEYALNQCEGDLDKGELLKVIDTLFEDYLNLKEEQKFIQLLVKYLNQYSQLDEYQLFRNTIFKGRNDIEVIKLIFEKVNFNDIQEIGPILNLIGRKLIEKKETKILIYIIEYYNQNIGLADLYVLKNYVTNMEDIDMIDYYSFESLFRKLEKNEQEILYKLLLDWKDLPVGFREEFFKLCPSEENAKVIADAFVRQELSTKFAKEKACEYYYDNDDIFLQIAGTETYSDYIGKRIMEKVKSKFIYDKYYTVKLLESIAEKDDKINELIDLIYQYRDNLLDIDNQVVFEDYKIVKKIKGDFVDRIYLRNIFQEENEVKAWLFKDASVKYSILNYFNENNIAYYEIGDYCVRVNEESSVKEIFELDIISFVHKVKSLFKLQKSLINIGALMTSFKNDSFSFSSKGFIPNKLEKLQIYEEEFVVRSTEDYFDIPEIKNSNGFIIIKEENIVKIIKKYLDMIFGYRIDNEKTLEEESIKLNTQITNKIYTNLINNSLIKTYDSCINELDKIIYESKREFESFSIRKHIKIFDELHEDEKENVVNSIISTNNTTLDAKNIVISWIDKLQNCNKVLLYLLGCFNESNQGLVKEDLQRIYLTIVNKFIKEEDSIIEEQKNEIVSFFIEAKDKTGFIKKEIENDIENAVVLNEEDKQYIISRI